MAKKYYIEYRMRSGKVPVTLDDEYLPASWLRWCRWKAYKTEKQRDQAFEKLLGNENRGKYKMWEYRKGSE